MTINDINALTFDTIQGYEESKGVAKNRNTRYRTAKYIALDSDGQEREYKVKVNNAGGPATITDLGKTRGRLLATIKPPMTPSGRKPCAAIDALNLPLVNFCQKATIGDALEGRPHWPSINAVCNWHVRQRLIELFPAARTTEETVKEMAHSPRICRPLFDFLHNCVILQVSTRNRGARDYDDHRKRQAERARN